MLREDFIIFFPCGRARQFSPNRWAVWRSGRNLTVLTYPLVSCLITKRIGSEATKSDTFNETLAASGRNFHPENDTPHYRGNLLNFQGRCHQKHLLIGTGVKENCCRSTASLQAQWEQSSVEIIWDICPFPVSLAAITPHSLLLIIAIRLISSKSPSAHCKENQGLFSWRGKLKKREQQGLAQNYPGNQWHTDRSTGT